MAQPVAQAQYYAIGTIGTNVISNESASLVRVVVPGTYVGTVIIHDAAATDGTTATSPILTFGLPATNYPRSVDVGATFRKGIVTEQTGTPVITLVWDK